MSGSPAMPPALAPAAVVDALQWRYAVKKFDPSRTVAPATWAALERSMVLAPSSFGLQPWKFVVVTNKALRARLREHSWNQGQVTDASHLVVFCRKTSMSPADVQRYIDRIAEVRGVPAASLDGYKGMMNGFVQNPPPGFDVNAWTARQTYIALGFFLSAAAVMGVDTCPMEGFDSGKYDEALGLSGSGFSATVICPAGYRAADDGYAPMKKVRFADADLIRRVE